MFERGAPVSGWTIVGLSQVRAQNPSTTLGIEARISIAGFRIFAHARGRVLAQVDPGAEAERRGDDHRDPGDDECADHDRLRGRRGCAAGTSHR